MSELVLYEVRPGFFLLSSSGNINTHGFNLHSVDFQSVCLSGQQYLSTGIEARVALFRGHGADRDPMANLPLPPTILKY